jgi:hypothetical protein
MRRTLRALAILLCAGLTAHADDDDNASKRADLMDRLDRAVNQIASEISGGADQRSSDVDDAARADSDVRDLLGNLKDVAGDDDKARSRLDKWPDYVDRFNGVVEPLKKLADGEKVLDAAEDKCKQAESNLQSVIRDAIGAPEKGEEGIQKITDLATALGKEYSDKLQVADAIVRDRKDLSDRVRNFNASDGPWSDVTSRVGNTASALHQYTADKLDRAHRACDAIAKGMDNSDVKNALEQLRSARSTTDRAFEDVKKDYDDWKRLKTDFTKAYRSDVDEIRALFCAEDDEGLDAKVATETNNVASALSSIYGTLTGRADLMLKQLEPLEKVQAIKDKVQKLENAIRSARRRLESVAKDGGELQGYNNPLIRAAVEYGKRMHLDMQGHCSAAEINIDGGNRRIDCVNAFSGGACDILEIKPNNSKARDAGQDQLDRAESWLEGHSPSDLPDDNFIRKNCVGSDGKFNIAHYKVWTYDYCPDPATLATPIDDSTSDDY